ncbi:MAG: hypothetical protein GC191_04545 [Azospirillum sp.]|nr:hypothetical protein [Azospirillum sp.]
MSAPAGAVPARDVSQMIAALIGLVAMGAVVGITAILFITKIEATLSEITTVFTPTAEAAEDMKMRFWEAVSVAEEIVNEPELAGLDRLNERFSGLARTYEARQLSLKQLVQQRDYLAKVERAKAAHQHFLALVAEATALRRVILQAQTTLSQATEAFNRQGDELVHHLAALAERNAAGMADARNKGDAMVASWQGSAREVNGLIHSLFDLDLPMVDASLKLGRIVEALRAAVAQYLAEPRLDRLAGHIDHITAHTVEARSHLDTLARLAHTDEGKAAVSELEQATTAWFASASAQGDLRAIHRKLLEAQARTLEITRGFEQEAEDLVVNLRAVAVHADQVSRMADQEVHQQVELAVTLTAIIILVMIMVATRMIFKLLRPAA